MLLQRGRRNSCVWLPACFFRCWCDGTALLLTGGCCRFLRRHGGCAAQARVPNLCRGGVTDTARSALTALAVMEPLGQMLGQRGMLEVGWGQQGWLV